MWMWEGREIQAMNGCTQDKQTSMPLKSAFWEEGTTSQLYGGSRFRLSKIREALHHQAVGSSVFAREFVSAAAA
jgi:hypothetical protein